MRVTLDNIEMTEENIEHVLALWESPFDKDEDGLNIIFPDDPESINNSPSDSYLGHAQNQRKIGGTMLIIHADKIHLVGSHEFITSNHNDLLTQQKGVSYSDSFGGKLESGQKFADSIKGQIQAHTP